MQAPLIAALTLIALTVAIHASGAVALLRAFAVYRRFWAHHVGSAVSILSLSGVVASLVLLHILEIMVWASYFRLQGLFPDLETATYFSLSTYTTIGFGDIVLAKGWRILGTVEGLVGVLMTGWSVAILVGLLPHLYEKLGGVSTDAVDSRP